MTAPRRIGTESAASRALLLDAAERLLLRDGYAAVTSRKLAIEAGLKPQLVHYYFRTMDDLFLAVFRRRAEQVLAQVPDALDSPRPLRALWDFNRSFAGAAFNHEFVALGNHRKVVKAEMAAYAERFRALQLEAVSRAMPRGGPDPAAVVVLLTAISQVLVLERELGMTTGHDAAVALVESYLDRLEPEA